MKKTVLLFLLLLIIASVANANPNRYKIFMERAGFWGGSSFMMVNTETGQSWKYNGRMWEPIPRIEEEVTGKPDLSVMMTKHEEEVKALNLKQAEEINFLNAKHEREIAELQVRLEMALRGKAKKTVSARPRQIRKAGPDESENGDNAPPAWLNEE
ncbi:MAG: hypothetical protein WCW67_03560 [Candidatus Margulisiibacteriota bacterium]|jgi:hypothetical protein